MTRIDYLNAASDLRRIANWMARGQKEKLPLIIKLWSQINSQKETARVTDHFIGNIKPQEAVKNKRLRLFFAEQALLSSLRLQHKYF